MKIISYNTYGPQSEKTCCDLCNEEPENEVLIEKPKSKIVRGQVLISHQPNPLHICVECLITEIEITSEEHR